MPFREDLDVTPFLAKLGIEDHGLYSSVIRVAGVDSSRPYRAGQGPTTCSTSTELIPAPGVVWDVNGYYRRFGLAWPYREVTRRELRERAVELFAREGQREWDTFALGLLLHDTPARREYRSRPLGVPYLDRFYSDLLKGMAAEVASALTAAGDQVTAREVLASWDLHLPEEETTTGSGEPVPEPEEPTEPAPDETLSEVSATQTWDWSFYVQTAPTIDLDQLRQWQGLLITALNYLTDNRPEAILEGLAVGVAGSQEWDWNVEAVDGELVFLINADRLPDLDMAAEALEWVTRPEQTHLFALRAAQRGTDEME